MDIYVLIVLSILGLLSLINLIVSIIKKCPDMSEDLQKLSDSSNQMALHTQGFMKDEFRYSREEMTQNAKNAQDLLSQRLNVLANHQTNHLNAFQSNLNELIESNHKRFHELQGSLSKAMNQIRSEVNVRLESIQKDNHQQLEKMRYTVDEKLHKTLEERLGHSFELVSKHLEAVQKGLGEMQSLATGVGDLKKVLSNVKSRGVLGEIQLANILDEILTPDQYGLNIATIPGSGCHVEFALKLPGKDDDGKVVWLPIDSKFPMDKYEQLNDAIEEGDMSKVVSARKAMVSTIKSMAKDINTKYIGPPHTTDFGILFLPIEGIYAEVVRVPGLLEELQRQYKIVVAGPSNLAAFLNSIQMGFRSMAIQKRSSEVWKVLGAVKTEFGKFGGVLDKVQTKLQQASKTIDEVNQRSRAIERNLRQVEELPEAEPISVLDDGLQMSEISSI